MALERRFRQPDGAKLALERRFGQLDGAKLDLQWRFGRPAGAKFTLEPHFGRPDGDKLTLERLQVSLGKASWSDLAPSWPWKYDFDKTLAMRRKIDVPRVQMVPSLTLERRFGTPDGTKLALEQRQVAPGTAFWATKRRQVGPGTAFWAPRRRLGAGTRISGSAGPECSDGNFV